jgi:hypothetical protein
MSQAADFCDALNEISDMGPLSERETRLAQMVVSGYTSESGYADVRDDREWYGEKAVKTLETLIGQPL